MHTRCEYGRPCRKFLTCLRPRSKTAAARSTLRPARPEITGTHPKSETNTRNRSQRTPTPVWNKLHATLFA
eukprot:1636775-Rhodomonas_salina.2